MNPVFGKVLKKIFFSDLTQQHRSGELFLLMHWVETSQLDKLPHRVKVGFIEGASCVTIIYPVYSRFFLFFFSLWVFFHEHLRFTGQQGKWEAISFNSSLQLLPASQTFRHFPRTAQSSLLYIASSWTIPLKCDRPYNFASFSYLLLLKIFLYFISTEKRNKKGKYPDGVQILTFLLEYRFV